MIKFCGACGDKIEVDRDDKSLYNYCSDCEAKLDIEKKTEDDRNPISRNGPWHNIK